MEARVTTRPTPKTTWSAPLARPVSCQIHAAMTVRPPPKNMNARTRLNRVLAAMRVLTGTAGASGTGHSAM